MKARLTGVFLCIVSFVLSMLLLLQLMNNAIQKAPDLGVSTPESQTVPVGDGNGTQTSPAVSVQSVNEVKAIAKETNDYFAALATAVALPETELSAMIEKWNNAANYLSGEAADAAGGAYYSALSAALSDFSAAYPTDEAAFAQKVNAILLSLETASVKDAGDPDRYPALDLTREGAFTRALLRLWNVSQNSERSITVTFGGEIAMGDLAGASTYMDKYGPKEDGTALNPLLGVVPVFAADDLTIVSLAGPLTTSQDKQVAAAFRGSFTAAYASHLKNAGVDVVVLASCHMFDYGESGYEETVKALTDAGLKVVDVNAPSVISTDAGKVAVHAFDLSAATVKETDVKSSIEKAKSESPILNVVYFHTANANNHTYTTALAMRAAADAGADLVLGSHGSEVEGMLFRGEKKTALVLSPGHLSYAVTPEVNKEVSSSFLYQQTFTIENVQVSGSSTPRVFAIDNHSADEELPYAPTLVLNRAKASAVCDAILATLRDYEGRVNEGDFSCVMFQG